MGKVVSGTNASSRPGLGKATPETMVRLHHPNRITTMEPTNAQDQLANKQCSLPQTKEVAMGNPRRASVSIQCSLPEVFQAQRKLHIKRNQEVETHVPQLEETA